MAAAMQGRRDQGLFKQGPRWNTGGEMPPHGREVTESRVKDQVVDSRPAADQFFGGLGVSEGDRGAQRRPSSSGPAGLRDRTIPRQTVMA